LRWKKIHGRERKRSLLLLENFHMSDLALKKMEELLDEVAALQAVFRVDVKLSPSHHIRVFIDADEGVTIEKCTAVSRALYKRIEESGLFAGGNFSLDVSSPGVDEPLKLRRQYKKNTGRKVEVVLMDGSKVTGTLINVNDDEMIVEEKTGKGNKQITKQITISFNQVQQTRVLITF
jgi:ribosome maturation factor RimP